MNPKIPQPRVPAPPPNIDDAAVAAERDDKLLSRKGRAATYVSTAAGRSAGGAATKVLLGQGG